jgi:anti-anti-sigma regulatory factor
MLMITEQRNSEGLRFRLAGALAGDWAIELNRCWREVADSATRPRVTVDLSEVTFVDDAGKDLLRSMAREGVELVARDILMKSIVEDIARDFSIA